MNQSVKFLCISICMHLVPIDDVVANEVTPDSIEIVKLEPQTAPPSSDKSTSPNYLRKKASSSPEKVPSNEYSSLSRVTLALFFLATLSGIALYAKRKRGGPLLSREHVRLHTIGSVQLGPRTSVALLSVGTEAILVGVTEHGINGLRTYGSDEIGALTVGPRKKKEETNDESEEASQAFNELLLKASKKDSQRISKHRQETASVKRAAQIREVVPAVVAAQRYADVGSSDELPVHLRDALAEPIVQERSDNVRPLRPAEAQQTHSGFDEPDGQAAELMRRFSELAR